MKVLSEFLTFIDVVETEIKKIPHLICKQSLNYRINQELNTR